MASQKKFIKNCEMHLEDGETFRYAFTAESGRFSRRIEALAWIPGLDPLVKLLVISNKPRVVVISNKRIMVLTAGRLSRMKPKTVLETLPRSTLLEHGTGRRSTLKLGNQSLRVEHNVYSFLDKANAEIANTTTTG